MSAGTRHRSDTDLDVMDEFWSFLSTIGAAIIVVGSILLLEAAGVDYALWICLAAGLSATVGVVVASELV